MTESTTVAATAVAVARQMMCYPEGCLLQAGGFSACSGSHLWMSRYLWHLRPHLELVTAFRHC